MSSNIKVSLAGFLNHKRQREAFLLAFLFIID